MAIVVEDAEPGLFPALHTALDQVTSLIQTITSIEMELLGRSIVREYDMQPQPTPKPSETSENECMPHVQGAVFRLQNSERRMRVAQDALTMLMGKLVNQGHLSPASSVGPQDRAYDELVAKSRAGLDYLDNKGARYQR